MKCHQTGRYAIVLFCFSALFTLAQAQHEQCADKRKQIEYQIKQAQLQGNKAKENRLNYQLKTLGNTCHPLNITQNGQTQREYLTETLENKQAELSILTSNLTDAKNKKDAERALLIHKKLDRKKEEIKSLQEALKQNKATQLHQQSNKNNDSHLQP